MINIKGRENLDLLKKQNIPAIFFSIHQSNWEICVPLLDRMGFKIGAIYRHVNNKYIDNFIYRKRKNSLISKDSFYTPKGKKSAKDIIEGINNKKSIFLLIDQKDSAGDYINLFGRPVKTQTGFLKIARKYQMPIIPVKNKRLENNKFEITFQNPLNHTNDKISDENKMLEIHKIIEKWIKEEPSQWFWQHKRFN